MQVSDIVEAIEAFAPPALAGDWDNTGLIAGDPAWPVEGPVLLTIDLTEPVAAEALRRGAGMVVAYHPPIFRPVPRLDAADGRSRAVLALLRAGVALYSPHSALDATPGGMADWLLDVVCPTAPVAREALQPALAVPAALASSDLPVGAGRIGVLADPVPLAELAAHAARALGVPAVKCASAGGASLRRVAVCPGAGATLFPDAAARAADVFVTGEAGHHDVLAAVDRGLAVILAGHTHTERGYLPRFADRLASVLDGVAVAVSAADTAPAQMLRVDG
jgi:dinuclear metal center YbgI/SA1388 family protein